MTQVVSITAARSDVEVDLWGGLYKLIPSTRSVIKKAEGLQDKAAEVEDEDAAVEFLAKALDLRVKPTKKGQRKASTMVIEKWKADELSQAQLLGFLANLAEAEDEARPT